MEFGFSLPSRGQAATMQNMRLLAQHVEALGLDSVWVSDHIIVPRRIDSFYPYDPEGRFPSTPDQDYYEPLTTLAFLAACTTRVQLGTSSPAAMQDDIGRYADGGVSHMVFDILTTDVAEMHRVMERFARDVKGGVRA